MSTGSQDELLFGVDLVPPTVRVGDFVVDQAEESTLGQGMPPRHVEVSGMHPTPHVRVADVEPAQVDPADLRTGRRPWTSSPSTRCTGYQSFRRPVSNNVR